MQKPLTWRKILTLQTLVTCMGVFSDHKTDASSYVSIDEVHDNFNKSKPPHPSAEKFLDNIHDQQLSLACSGRSTCFESLPLPLRVASYVSYGVMIFSILYCIGSNIRGVKLDDITDMERCTAQESHLAKEAMEEQQLGTYDPSEWVSLTQLCRVNAHGSVFRHPIIVRQTCYVLGGTVIVLLMLMPIAVGREVAGEIDRCSSYLLKFLPFFFAMYTNTLLGRWWTARTSGVGGITNAVMELVQLAATESSGDEGREAHQLMLRYGVLTFDLTFMQARKQVDLQELVDKGYLLDDEREALASIQTENGNPSQAVWVWIQALWTAIEDAGIIGERPAKRAQKVIGRGKESTRAAATIVGCQVPMSWVHVIATMVNFCIVILCISCAVQINRVLQDEHGFKRKIARMGIAFIELLLVPLVYGGFLALGNELMNPFGKDSSAFPRLRYLQALSNEGKGIQTSVDNLPPALRSLY